MVSSPELGFKFFTKAAKTVPDPIYTTLACEGGEVGNLVASLK